MNHLDITTSQSSPGATYDPATATADHRSLSTIKPELPQGRSRPTASTTPRRESGAAPVGDHGVAMRTWAVIKLRRQNYAHEASNFTNDAVRVRLPQAPRAAGAGAQPHLVTGVVRFKVRGSAGPQAGALRPREPTRAYGHGSQTLQEAIAPRPDCWPGQRNR